MIYYGKDYPTTNRDEYDEIADGILSKSSKDESFPLHHAIACNLRAAEANGFANGKKIERQALVKMLTKLSKSWEFVLRHDAAEVCKSLMKQLLGRD